MRYSGGKIISLFLELDFIPVTIKNNFSAIFLVLSVKIYFRIGPSVICKAGRGGNS